MCGRYSLTTEQDALNAALGVEGLLHPRPRYNIAPGQDAPVLRADDRGEPLPDRLRWGLVPSWARDPSVANRLVNARLETASRKPSFRDAFSRARCLVPMDGFFEWRASSEGKVPWWIHGRGEVFTLAGLHERWEGPGGVRTTFTILTRPAPPPLDRIHHRAPVVVSSELRGAWLAPGPPSPELHGRLLEGSFPTLAVRRVSRRVNRPDHDDPACIRDVGNGDGDPPPPEQTSLFGG